MLAAAMLAAGLCDLPSYPGLAGLLSQFPSGTSGAGNQYRSQKNRSEDGPISTVLFISFLRIIPSPPIRDGSHVSDEMSRKCVTGSPDLDQGSRHPGP